MISTRMLFLGVVWLLAGWPALGAVLEVGADKPFAEPSQALATAKDGDVVRIQPGQYYDCSIIAKNDLTIEGVGPGVVMTDRTCAGKALLVIDGDNVTIRGLTLQRARVLDRNGAGIRAEGTNLTVEHVIFIDNEAGILGADMAGSTIHVLDSEFRQNGRCVATCTHAIAVGHIARLHVEHSRLLDTNGGNAIFSWADRTEILDNDIEDGKTGTSSALVDLPGGGDLVMTGNRLQTGPAATSDRVVVIGDQQRGAAGATQVVTSNTLVDDGAKVEELVLNWGAADPAVSRNTLPAGVAEISSGGSLWHRVHAELYQMKLSVMGVLGFAHRHARALLPLVVVGALAIGGMLFLAWRKRTNPPLAGADEEIIVRGPPEEL